MSEAKLTVDTNGDLPDISPALVAFDSIASNHEQDIKAIFEVFDSDKDGLITVADLKRVFESTVETTLDNSELTELMAEAGVTDSEAKIDLKTFEQMMTSADSPFSPTSRDSRSNFRFSQSGM
mmetsp:Transcript_22005/g.43745  ORF Transcript_22005/g.43745 Transcript_22005/m.43745 type:complete len:123 (-) Transcript_22005:45-413(-)